MAATLSLLSPTSLSSLRRHHPTPTRIHLRTNPSKFSIKAFSAPVLTQDDLKKLAADKAVEYVKSGMVLGLGTGSTAAFVVDKLGALLKSGELTDIVGVPTSKRTQEQAAALGIPSPPSTPIPTSTSQLTELTRLQGLFKEEGCDAKLRLDRDGKPYVTDNSNYIVDLYFKTPIRDSGGAGKEIAALEGVVEHGLFLDMATAVIIAGGDGVSVKANLHSTMFVRLNGVLGVRYIAILHKACAFVLMTSPIIMRFVNELLD
ncbi:hypothetical protein DH2020_035252 [Rehmannia glutinosa]|uniref:ribose-5-phosphate isomerase n=1 Tax=Rehmannia glutinosa TaxID=99300 RepID=A0ABR0VAE3_REHGL